jgi:hypothetical protein
MMLKSIHPEMERVDFDKIFNWSFGEPVAKGKAPAPLTFVAFV